MIELRLTDMEKRSNDYIVGMLQCATEAYRNTNEVFRGCTIRHTYIVLYFMGMRTSVREVVLGELTNVQERINLMV